MKILTLVLFLSSAAIDTAHFPLYDTKICRDMTVVVVFFDSNGFKDKRHEPKTYCWSKS